MHTLIPCRITAFVFLLFLTALSCALQAEPLQLMLATKWQSGDDPSGWWMSEKFDGMRGYWNGTQMLTRGGEPIALPQTWRGVLPPFPLDGELWAGRGRFSETVAVVRDKHPGPGWAQIRYLVFDAPAAPGPFEARLAVAKEWLAGHASKQVELIEQRRCSGHQQLERFLDGIEAKGGEGVMLRAAVSPYQTGRSPYLRKVKRFDDTEAKVVGYNPGKGKYTGMVGSLRMELHNGVHFAIGSGLRDEQRRNPPPIGSTVTFKHHGWTANGKPRFPVFWRIREIRVDK